MSENDYDHENPNFYMVEFFKKWHRGGFLSARYWPHAEKVQIEIGTTDPNTKEAISVSKCFLETFTLMTYLHAETNAVILNTYPDFQKDEWKIYGGSGGSDAVSRVFTAGMWRATADSPIDTSKRGFRCGNYKGKMGPNGSIIPIYDQVISFDMIQMKIDEIARMYHSLSTVVNAYAVQKSDQVVVFNE